MKVTLAAFRYGVPLTDPCIYPLGFMYISAMLRKLGHQVKVLNWNLWHFDLADELEGQDVLCMSGAEEFLRPIQIGAEIARRAGVKTVLGGALATYRTAKMAEIVDSVVTGEGEGALEAALAERGVFHGNLAPFSEIPLPDYDGFGIDEYHRRHKIRYMGVLTARGCPFRCSFCASICNYRERPLAEVFDEIDLYRDKYGIDYLVVNDNTLNARKARFLEFCDGMAGRGLKWSAAIRTDRFSEEMAKAAKRSGAHYFVVGVESFLQDRLDKMGKKTTVGDNERTLDLLHKHDIRYHGNVILGFDWERESDIKREIDAIPRHYNIFPALLQPFVGIKAKVGIHGEKRAWYSGKFMQFAKSRGMTVYPEIASC